jgi:L-lactate dehydrogenase
VLDSARLRRTLATRFRVSPASVHALIAGEHGNTEFPLWSSARIGPVPILEWRRETGSVVSRSELDAIADEVKNAAYSIIQGKGATNYAIGLAGARIVEAILRDEGIVLPVSSVLDDYHGVSGVALSVPTLVDASGIERVLDVSFDEEESERFAASAAAMRAELDQLGID